MVDVLNWGWPALTEVDQGHFHETRRPIAGSSWLAMAAWRVNCNGAGGRAGSGIGD
jgi:hypothetical protein